MKSRKNEIQHGDVDIPDEAFLPENYKQRISIMLQGNVLNWFKTRSAKTGVPYQNLIQMALAEYMENLEHVVKAKPKKRA